MSERLLIVGGSVRAAAMSARNAGFMPIAIDRFADADLRDVCREFQRYDQLRQVPELAQRLPEADWIYTGPLENHPALIRRLGKQRRLLGNTAATLRKVRDPWQVAAALIRAGLPCPELCPQGEQCPQGEHPQGEHPQGEHPQGEHPQGERCSEREVPAGNQWLYKPLRAAGGFGIQRASSAWPGARDNGGAWYWQKFVPGHSLGAVFLAAGGRSVLVGVTQQLLGPTWGGSREFQYAGSIGPVTLAPGPLQALQRVGDCLAESFPVQGLFGVDVILNEDRVWPVEVNPRYTASVEILERAGGVEIIRWHVAACRCGELPDVRLDTVPQSAGNLWGKAIVYADREWKIDANRERALRMWSRSLAEPPIADIPNAGTTIRAGEPIATVFATGGTTGGVEQELRATMYELVQVLSLGSGRV